MNLTTLKRYLPWLLAVLMCLSLAACSGGSGGDGQGQVQATPENGAVTTTSAAAQTVYGVAATGVPVYGTVTLKDRNAIQLGPFSTDNDGAFSFDVTGLTPPFMLKAEYPLALGAFVASNTLFSVATSPGQANINPFSNLVLQVAAGQDLSAIYGQPGASPDASKMNESEIATALAKVRTVFMPLLTKYGTIDFNPVNGPYVAGPSNTLDTILDVLAIQVENGTVTVRNRLGGAVLASGALNNLADMQPDITKAPDTATLTDIKEITAWLQVLCAAMNLEKDLTMSDLEGLFIAEANYGKSNGRTRTQDMQSIVDIFGPNGTNTKGRLSTIRNLKVASDLSTYYAARGVAKVYIVSYDFIHQSSEVVHGQNVILGKESVTGQWKFIGDPVGWTIRSNGGLITMIGPSTFTESGRAPINVPIFSSNGSTGSYNLVGGTLNVTGNHSSSISTTGSMSTGSFTQNSGGNNYSMFGGTPEAMYIGNGGKYTLAVGTLHVTSIYINGGTFTANGGSVQGTIYINNGGTVTVGQATIQGSIYVNGGTLSVSQHFVDNFHDTVYRCDPAVTNPSTATCTTAAPQSFLSTGSTP